VIQTQEVPQVFLDEAVHKRLVAMTTDFETLWTDSATPNRERKRLLAYIIEDATLIKLSAEGITKVHVRFKGGTASSGHSGDCFDAAKVAYLVHSYRLLPRFDR
jgi:hypothetical protein